MWGYLPMLGCSALEQHTRQKKVSMSEIPLIAIVDDDAAVRASMQRLISSAGFRAEVFASAEDFWHAAQRQDTACLIVDVRMPRMSGLEFQQQLTSASCPIPLIFITAHGDDETRAQALRAGAVAFLDKPFSEEVLLRAVQAALQRSRGGGKGSPSLRQLVPVRAKGDQGYAQLE
jgi:FixJ family two-component response regulator